MSASGKSAGKGGGQNRSAGGLKTGGAVQPMPGGFYPQPLSQMYRPMDQMYRPQPPMYQPSNTASVYNPGERVFDRMTPEFQSDYRPGLDFYGPTQSGNRLLVNQPMPGYYQQYPAPGSNYAPPAEPVIPDPTPEPTEPRKTEADRRQDILDYFREGGFGAPIGPEDFGFYEAPPQNLGRGRQQVANTMARHRRRRGQRGAITSAPILDQTAGNTANTQPQVSPYEQRIQTLMGRGMTREQAMQNQNTAISQGADYDLSGFVTDDELRKFRGQQR